MTTLQARKDPLPRGVSPTPSKIPVRSQRRPPLPTVKSCAVDQENQDPRRLVQKLNVQRPLVDSAGPRLKATHQTEKSERLVGSTQLRNPLEELRPSPGGHNVEPGPPPQTEAPGATEFVADPEALATILSASSFPEGEHEVVTHSDEGGGGPLGLAQRVPLRETREITYTRDSRDSHLMLSPGRVAPPSIARPSPFGRAQRVPSPGLSAPTSYSVLRRLAIRPKVQYTPISSAPRVQRRIGILQQLLQQEVEGLAGGKVAPINGGSSLDMVELQPLLAEISRTLNAPEHNSGTFHLPGLSQHSGLPKPCLPEEGEEPQPCPGAEPEVAQPCPPAEPGPPESCHRRGPEIPEPSAQEQPEVSEPCPPVEPGPLQACPQRQTGLPEPSPRVEPGASEACSLEPRNPKPSPQPCCRQGAPETTSLIFSSQRPLCASPPIRSLQSLRPPTGQAGPSSLAPRTLALRQRLKACLTAIHCFHEARLDDECAFYTSRAHSSGPTRVCTNPVATLLEWQDALVSLWSTARLCLHSKPVGK
ncbi:hypothetical protein HPG69_015159 [Diceros bicornis minor]|uniref:Tastin n=1 Tax=Diceros bicornis minor TaxID=77932 RepID=A0A7J7FKF7_DICBM|nr:hypothetical protein HPG69_015159 [Diceros bicornis minor]